MLKTIEKSKLKAYMDKGIRAEEIGEIENASAGTVRRWMREYGLRYRVDTKSPAWGAYLANEIEQGKTLEEIGKANGFSRASIIHHVAYHGLKSGYRQNCERLAKDRELVSKETLKDMIERGMSYRNIGKEVGLAEGQIQGLCEEMGLKSKKAKGIEKVANADREQLARWIEAGMCASEIALEMGLAGVGTIRRMLKRFDLVAMDGGGKGWTNDGNPISPPCEYLKEILRANKILFKEELKPLIDRKYRIDIAFPSLMLALEVNGNFHYEDKEHTILAPYYKERDKLISEAGWESIQIHFASVWDTVYVSELIAMLKARLVD